MLGPVEARVALIPLADLQAMGEITDYLQIPTDVLPALAILSGVSEVGPKLASFTPAGALRTADTGAGYTHVDPHEGSIMNNSVTVNFNKQVGSVVVNIDTQQCTIAFSMDAQNFDGAMTVLAGEKVSIDIVCRAIRVTNTSGTTATGYRIWGLYY